MNPRGPARPAPPPHEKDRRGGRAFGRKVLVGCLAERSPQGRIQLDVLERHSFDEDLGPFIRGAIEGAETTIRSDGLWSYKPLSQAGVRHERVVQGHGSRGPKLLPATHTTFYHLKSRLRGTFRGASRKHLARYLQEFTFRFNHRHEERELALLVLRRALGGSPLPYARLTAEGSA